MKRAVIAFAILAYIGLAVSACKSEGHVAASDSKSALATNAAVRPRFESAEAELTEQLKTLCANAGGEIGVAVIHVETGQSVTIEGSKQLPLYSVFKLPLAVAVLKEVAEKRLSLETKVKVTPQDVGPGSQFNTDVWRQPVDKTLAELLELAIVRSDNTSSDKLLEQIGGPAAVTERMRALGFSNIDIRYTTREFAAHRDKPNTGTASDLAHLLTQLQKGELLAAPQTELLLGLMTRALTGEHRLRGNLPAGTPVADKTGTGAAGATTNDVGLITLPEGKGHLAMAVLLSGSKLTAEEQEKLIAKLARAAYDSYVSSPAGSPVKKGL